MKTTFVTKRSQQGMGLIVTLLSLMLLSTLAAGLLMVTNSQVWTTVNYRLTTQARYAAEYGAQQAAVWIANNNLKINDTTGLNTGVYPVQLTSNNNPVVLSAMSGVNANYPDSSVQNGFNNALRNRSVPGLANFEYSTYATLVSMTPYVAAGAAMYQQTWQITSQASIAGIRNAQVQVVENIQRLVGVPLYQYAIQSTGNGCSAVTLAGGASTDSFDSSAGSYSSTKTASGGNIESNGNLSLSGSTTTVGGSLYDPNPTGTSCSAGSVDALTTGGSASLTGTITTLSAPLTVPTPPAPSPAPPTTNESISGNCGGLTGCTDVSYDNVAFVPGDYGNLNVSGKTSLHLSAGVYNLNSIVVSGGSPIVIDSGPVILNIAGSGVTTAIDLTGGSITNNSGVPSNLQISYGGTAAVNLSGGAASYALVDAPNATITFSGGSNWYGAVIGKTVNDSGGTAIHYDRSLTTTITNGKFQIVGFNWSKF